jgi:hypothetical protein
LLSKSESLVNGFPLAANLRPQPATSKCCTGYDSKDGVEVIRFFGKVIVIAFRIQLKTHEHEKNMRSDGYVHRREALEGPGEDFEKRFQNKERSTKL